MSWIDIFKYLTLVALFKYALFKIKAFLPQFKILIHVKRDHVDYINYIIKPILLFKNNVDFLLNRSVVELSKYIDKYDKIYTFFILGSFFWA